MKTKCPLWEGAPHHAWVPNPDKIVPPPMQESGEYSVLDLAQNPMVSIASTETVQIKQILWVDSKGQEVKAFTNVPYPMMMIMMQEGRARRGGKDHGSDDGNGE
ncbi:hypothetical protein POX_e06740 [Penicillium oxalicum]|uniref:Uncharacterized protein n=1 Tax=Penicillium oxalicum (strain 114-2 / CGMCC 5302) TaxID=933388 RepID=S7ZBZ1_PENO1|nr:hypothetical protein POX_e06740 [Penicillium oxalicum]EPS27759.1 hypothetical protein PDE_02703 [Penicillium oxalicum 114-2]KAI2788719.1 hypothetical protein POX_e06740 [Penicillium oxalicum]